MRHQSQQPLAAGNGLIVALGFKGYVRRGGGQHAVIRKLVGKLVEGLQRAVGLTIVRINKCVDITQRRLLGILLSQPRSRLLG